MALIFIVGSILILSLDFYIFIRGHQALEGLKVARIVYAVLLWGVALLFFPAITLKHIADSLFVEKLWLVASFWLAAMTFLFIGLLAVDIFRLLWWLIVRKPLRAMVKDYRKLKQALFLSFSFATALLLCVGYANATRPRVVEYEVALTSPHAAAEKELTVAMISDLHLGLINGQRHLSRWVEAINDLNPDLLLIAGDAFDDSPAPVERKHLGELLQQIQPPLGKFAIAGNHDIMADFDRASAYLQENGIEMLVDRSVLIDSLFRLTGRMDRSVGNRHHLNGQASGARLSLNELLQPFKEEDFPIILLDHQPTNLDEAAQSGVALQLSGHTHKGQMWPFSLVTGAMYECDHGMLRKGNVAFIVSSGLGTWGPPVRLGSRSEIVLIRLKVTP